MSTINTWREKYASKGICDFDLNYQFYFKWLLNKVANCFVISGGDDTKVDKDYTKLNLILDGNICITDFNDELYACVGSIGGLPDEYYVPTNFIIANPILGSKRVCWRDFKGEKQNGVLISNTSIDKFTRDLLDCGLYTLIKQTATLLADNIVSINCCQINTRVQTIVVADSEPQQLAAETVLKEMYSGVPYKVMRQSIRDKITVSPTANVNVSQSITELVELHNYIIANFFQSIGVIANNVMKRERLITKEIDSQNEFVNLSLTEMLESWTKGFNEVNKLYGTDFSVKLNPTIIEQLVNSITNKEPIIPDGDKNIVLEDSDVGSVTVPNGEQEESNQPEPQTEEDSVPSQPETIIEDSEDVVQEIAQFLVDGNVTDEAKEEEGDEDVQSEDSED